MYSYRIDDTIFGSYSQWAGYNIKIMQQSHPERPGKNIFTLQVRKQHPSITIRSDFDSGNLAKVELGLNCTLVLTPANDCAGTQYESHAKGWFHFGVSGFTAGARQKFAVRRMNQLGGQVKFSDYFKPVYKYGQDGAWERLEQASTFNREQDTELHFEFVFQKNVEVFFAYCYPFSYQECQSLLVQLRHEAKSQKHIYYHDEVLIKSIEGRSLHLLTISSHQYKLPTRQSPVDDHLFPQSQIRPFKFTHEKRVVLLSARVHPGETPSSHTMNGLLKFLMSKDARAEVLRRNFVFKVVPMLNPDGVYHGHYRMDTYNQNLNRFYLDPDPWKQPSSYALKKLGEYFKLENRLAFFMDLHAHPQKKGNFIYGNSLETPEQQNETQLYPKLLSMNCVQFDYENSCFSKNHMTLKDRNQDLTKQGCSRVVFHRELGLIYSYTMECGYTSSNFFNDIAAVTNPHRKIDRLGLLNDQLDNIKSPYYSSEKKKYLTIKTYENLGKSIVITLLDLFSLNPFSRIPNSHFKTLDDIRNDIRSNLMKMSKDYKIYSQKVQPPPIQHRNIHKTANPTFSLVKSVPKPLVLSLLDKKVISSKFIATQKESDTKRRKTLPKMRNAKG